jgi:LL-diaminopimelate aminotransferase
MIRIFSVFRMRLTAENNFLPKLEVLEDLLKKHQPKMMILNFPSNPTSVMTTKEELKPLVDLAKKYQCLIAYDNAYSEVYYDENKKPCSILEVEGAKDIAIEFHSFSKTFQMTGWRIGFAVGNEELVKGLLKLKTNIDSGPFLATQETASFGLQNYSILGPQMRGTYLPRKELMAAGLKRLGIEFIQPDATFFIWARSPLGLDSMTFCKKLIEKEGIVITPGVGFGKEGEGFFRMSLTVSEKLIEEFLCRLERFQKSF